MAVRTKRKAAPKAGLVHDVKVRLDAELREGVRSAAAREERSESAIVRRALRAYLEVAT